MSLLKKEKLQSFQTPAPQTRIRRARKKILACPPLKLPYCETICELAATMTADSTALHLLELGFQLLDLGVGLFEILVEAVALGNKLLLPLSEPLLLDLNLFGETLAQSFFLFLELGVVQLAGSGLAEFTSLHLLSTIRLIVQLFCSVNKVEHMSSDQDGTKLLEVAVVLVLDLSNTPRVLTTLDDAAIVGLDVLLGTDDGERHSSHEASGVLSSSFIILLDRGLIDLDVLGFNNRDDSLLELGQVSRAQRVGLGNNRDQVDPRAEPLHDFNIERLQSVAGRADEVQAGVDSKVNLVLAARLLLLKHVGFVLVVEELDNGHPRVTVVDVVAESGSINDGQTDLEELLLELSLGDLNFDSLVDLLLMSALVVGIVLDSGGEESVDEGGLA
uniref:Uncharacterized protein n=1 Tax=Photinus pyralis TaxID=7054 RepID=A0A1Y1LA43_PHOPY